jgi:sugar-specific transcriptional regulator TrmB
MQTDTLFERLGLHKHASTAYSTLRKKGPFLVTELAREAGLHQPAAYQALRDLSRHRFIFKTRTGKRTLYHAADPSIITAAFAAASEKVAESFAEKTIRKEKFLREGFRFFNGLTGIRQAFDDVIAHTKRGETFYRYTSEKDLDRVNSYLSKNYRERRDQKKLERLVISNPESGRRKRSRLERFIKFIPPEASLFDQDIIQLVYGDRLSFIDLNQETVVIIENRALAEFQKVIFRQLYKKL